MNATMEKFGYPATLLRELEHWVILLRPAQVTLGSLVLAAKGDATAYSALPPAAFAEQGAAVGLIERGLAAFVEYEKINYLMLMMVDPNPHFHVIPRYSQPRRWGGLDFPDAGWPSAPQLGAAIALDDDQIARLRHDLSDNFR
ncbi:hydrolase [Sphingomonas sp. URHD0057]|uniref:hydrolase n=1 Tax=Sphingomonas sp. URHD0057 TaxID=1380389 RepID=UPI00048FBF5D|nr:hydrolase [Sphingomonas sp. URHD0057]